MNPNYKGVWTAIVTPFTSSLHVDTEAFDKLLLLQKEAGIYGIVIAGSTGEGSTLSTTEKLSLMKRARALLGKDYPLMGSIGGSDTAQSVELAQLYQDAGASSLLVVTPPYNKPSLAGLKLHFSQIAAKVHIPLCLYHVPGRTALRLDAQALKELCTSLPSLTMVKEASGDIALFAAASLDSQALYFSGDDPTYLGSLAYNGAGSISVISNIFPKAWVQMSDAFHKGDRELAFAIHRAVWPLNSNLYCEGNPTPLKTAMSVVGLCPSYLRPPLAPLTSGNDTLIRESLENTLASLKRVGF